MLLKKIELNPFGQFSNLSVEFDRRLNIVFGNNEAGKSTIFYAIQNILTLPVKLSKRNLERYIKRFIPILGDVASVKLEFKVNGRDYTLYKKWGERAEARLSGDRYILEDPEKIEEVLLKLTPALPSTIKTVLMSYQGGLIPGIEEIFNNSECFSSLKEILRKVVMSSCGISIEKFKEKVQNLYREYFSRWDVELGLPEKRRGIENRWEKEVGIVLNHFYTVEETKKRLKEVREYEVEYEKINQNIVTISRELSLLEDFLNTNKKVLELARIKEEKNLQINNHRLKLEQYKALFEKWNIAETKLLELRKREETLKEKQKELLRLKPEAEKKKAIDETKELLNKVKPIAERLKEIKQKIDELPKIDYSELEEIKRLGKEVEVLKTKIEAGKFFIHLKAKDDVYFTIKERFGSEEPKNIRIKKGEEKVLECKGGTILDLTNMEVGLYPSVDLEEILTELEEKKSLLKEKLERYKISSVDGVEELYNSRMSYIKEESSLQKTLEKLLEGRSLEELKEKVSTFNNNINEVPPLEYIIKEEIKINENLKAIEKEKYELEKELLNYMEGYGKKERLIEFIVEERAKLTKLEEEEKEIKLPEDVKDRSSLIKEYEEKEKRYNFLKQQLDILKLERAKLEGRAPQISSEEIKLELEIKEAQFRKVIKEGMAIRRIKFEVEEILKGIDDLTYKDFFDRFNYYFEKLTQSRYKISSSSELINIKDSIVREDGLYFSHELLSTGIKDLFSIATKLAMAEYFLKDQEGFLVLDDPLVNLDPEKRKIASTLLKEFSQKKQVIIFTCHPEHVELLQGNIIKLQ